MMTINLVIGKIRSFHLKSLVDDRACALCEGLFYYAIRRGTFEKFFPLHPRAKHKQMREGFGHSGHLDF